MKISTLIFYGMIAGMHITGSGCCKEDPGNTFLSNADLYFLRQAAYFNISESKIDSLAGSNAGKEIIKILSRGLKTDHDMAEAELEHLASQWNLPLPEEPDAVHQQVYDRLQELKDVQFDTAYLHHQQSGHYQALKLYQDEIAQGEHYQVKNYASKYLSVVQQHLEKADSIEEHY